MSKLALPYVRQLPEGVYRQLMFQALAQRTGLELSSLMLLEAPSPAPTDALPDYGPEPDYEPPADYDGPPGPDHAQPEPSQPARFTHQAPAKGYSNLAQAAIALVLHQPDIAQLVSPDLQDGTDEVGGNDGQLLRELLQLLHRRPESSTAMLLGHWYGTDEGKLLSRLAGQERLIPATAIEQQFVDTMTALAHLPHKSKLAAQVDKLKLTNYAEMSELEKQRLKDLLQEKLQRDALRNKPKG
jgi:DNA primase